MKNSVLNTLAVAALLACLPAFAFAQKKETKKDSSVKIHVETYKNGKKEVFEKTYKGDEASQVEMENDMRKLIPNEQMLFSGDSSDKRNHALMMIKEEIRGDEFNELNVMDDKLQKERKKRVVMKFKNMNDSEFPMPSTPMMPMLPISPDLQTFKYHYDIDLNETKVYTEEDFDVREYKDANGKKAYIIKRKKPEVELNKK